GNRAPGGVDDAERGVAVLDRGGDDADGEQVVDLIHVNALALEFLVHAVKAFDAPLDAGRNVVLGEDGADFAVHAVEELLASGASAVHSGLDLSVGSGFEEAEREVLELATDFAHAEAVGQGSVDIHGLAGDRLLALGSEVLEVRMLCRRSASLMRMTRMSSTMASSILRTLSAWRAAWPCRSSRSILVTPSTRWATTGPNSRASCSLVAGVSSTASWRRPAEMQTTSISISARTAATASGWRMN